MTDLDNFALVNEIMASHFSQPYPARAAVGVSNTAWRIGGNGCGDGTVKLSGNFIASTVDDAMTISPGVQEKLSRLGIRTEWDLILHLPIRIRR